MSMHETPVANRIHIGIFGKRNAGKSSLINKITGQNLAIVSDVLGTTTDPVFKTMELLPLGPVVMIDTPGLDDEGELGMLRIKKAYQVLNKTDLAVLVVDAQQGMTEADEALLNRIKDKKIPWIVAFNKCDRLEQIPEAGEGEIYVSAEDGHQIFELKEMMAKRAVKDEVEKKILADLVEPGDTVVLVIPIDAAAPKGRIILPQQQVLRELLDLGCIAVCVQVQELETYFSQNATKPKLVITDSQAFGRVSQIVPKDVLLTSFSILFARYKGDLVQTIEGVSRLNRLKDGDRILIGEGCTHHRQCGDIGTEKLPAWIRGYTGKNLTFEFTSGTEFPDDLSSYSLIVHCGACMLNGREMKYRLKCAQDQAVPMTNYGMTIAYTHGILKRSLAPFPDIAALLEEA